MNKAIKRIAMLFMVCGFAVSGVVAKDYKYWEEYKELKAWIEDMKVKYPRLKTDDPEWAEEYGEYPKLTPFINDLEFLDDLDAEKAKSKKSDITDIDVIRKVANSPKWKCDGLCKKKETHYYKGLSWGFDLLRIAKKRERN